MVPIIASAADIPGALEYAKNHPPARWYVARMMDTHGQADQIPPEWGEAITAAGKMPKLGTGKRFANLKKQLAGRGVNNPGALAAYIGRKKFGAKKMGQLAAKGRTASAVTADASGTEAPGMPTAGWLRRVRAELTQAGLDPDYVEASLGGGFSAAYDGTDAVAYAEGLLDEIVANLSDEFPELLADDPDGGEAAGDDDADSTGDDTDPAPDNDDDEDDEDDEAEEEPAVAQAAPAVTKLDPSAPAPAPAAPVAAAPVAASGYPTTAGGNVFYVGGAPQPAQPVGDMAALTAAFREAVREELAPLIAAGRAPGPDDDPDTIDADAADAGMVDDAGTPLDPADAALIPDDPDADPTAADLDPDDPTPEVPAAAVLDDDGTDPTAAPAAPVDLEDAKAQLRARFGGKAKPKPAPVAASAGRVLTASAMRARIAEVQAAKTPA